MKMHTVGIIGGIGPESTIEYYRKIVSSFLKREANGNYPQVIINSINMKKMLDLIGSGKLGEVTDYLASEVRKLAVAGADFGLLASNTPHIVFDQVQQASPLPLISIVEATCKKTMALGLSRVGLLGTKFTMQGGFYNAVLSGQDIEVCVPGEAEQNYIHNKYMGELVKGIVHDETRSGLLNIIDEMKNNYNLQGLILGGTELPLILKQNDVSDLCLLDTTEIHVESILQALA
jgi:aspartate racemase